jgi:hypothetical protein
MKNQLLLALLVMSAVGLSYPTMASAGEVYEGKALNSVEGDMDRARISVDTESGIVRINFVAQSDRVSDITLTYDQLVGITAGEFERNPGFWELMARGRQSDYGATQFFIDYRTADGEVKSTRVYVDDSDGRRFENEMEELIERARDERSQQAQPTPTTAPAAPQAAPVVPQQTAPVVPRRPAPVAPQSNP